MAFSTLSSKGQTTIPQHIRTYLHLHAGDKLSFVIEPEGHVVLHPATLDIKALCGILKQKNQKIVSLSDMEKAILKGASKGLK